MAWGLYSPKKAAMAKHKTQRREAALAEEEAQAWREADIAEGERIAREESQGFWEKVRRSFDWESQS